MRSIERYFTKLNIVFAVHLLTVILTVVGVFPREFFLFLAGLLIFYFLFSPLEESVLYVARAIPLFVALPITETFDSLNMWRIFVLALFARWFLSDGRMDAFFLRFFALWKQARTDIVGALKQAWQEWRAEAIGAVLLFISFLSLVKAEDPIIGAKRIIYFVNLWMLFFVVRSVAGAHNMKRIAQNVLVGGALVLAVGMLQLWMAYTAHIDAFAEFWALKVNNALYGSAWANIAIHANTWFAYYNETIHLRMFSSFPDTHSFPQYLLMVVCFAMFLFFAEREGQKRMALAAITALAILETVLSGTRGIWASVVFPVLLLGYLLFRKYPFPRLVFMPFAFFIVALAVSGIVFGSTQFRLTQTGEERNVLTERIRSIIDTGETSNQGRIFIWKETLRSIGKNPLLGVGIGNFPVVLALDPQTIKAGASAHNIYLNFLAEIGIFGFLAFLLILGEMLKRGWWMYRKEGNASLRFFGLNFLLYFVWILWYSMTDVAIFDERSFLLLMILAGAIFAVSDRRKLTIDGTNREM